MLSKILSINPETADTVSFHFEKPAGFDYYPGQFINIELPQDQVPFPENKRNFSLSSSPTENFLSITIRHGKSPLKQYLEKMKTGGTIQFTGPFGKFMLNEDPQIPAVFLTGGIGITPFHSMIKYATDKNMQKKITLIYSNKRTDDIVFKNELDRFVQKNPNLNIHYTVTQTNRTRADEAWHGRTGRINETMIREIVADIMKVEFYVVGPVKMVLDLKATLKTMGVIPEKLHSELFTGY